MIEFGHRQAPLKNNLGFAGGTEVAELNAEASEVSGNYFNLPVTINGADFQSVDESELTRPRQANGVLPNVRFLHLTATSDAVDQGVDVGRTFAGRAPDLGAFEFQP